MGTLKAAYGVFKKSPARRADYLEDNELGVATMKWCGHRWLENGICIDRFLEVKEKLSVFFEKSRDRKNLDKKDERFPLLLKT